MGGDDGILWKAGGEEGIGNCDCACGDKCDVTSGWFGSGWARAILVVCGECLFLVVEKCASITQTSLSTLS
jgi:hypothetical protein